MENDKENLVAHPEVIILQRSQNGAIHARRVSSQTFLITGAIVKRRRGSNFEV